MTALAEALAASQSKAVAALGRAYVRREEAPDDELFSGLLHKIGLDDDVAIAFLLAAWKVLRDEKAAPPGEAAPTKSNGSVSDEEGPLRWTAGKHKGMLLTETPTDYLEWAAQSHPDPIARQRASGELSRRADEARAGDDVPF